MGSNIRSSIFRPAAAAVLLTCVVVLGVLPTIRSQGNVMPDCLYAGSDYTAQDDSRSFLPLKHGECKKDILKISDLVAVRETESMFGLRSDQITFVGCA